MGKGGNSKAKAQEAVRKGVVVLNFLYLILGAVIISSAGQFGSNGNKAATTEIISRGLSLGNVSAIMMFMGIMTIIIAAAGLIGAYFKYRKAMIFYIITLLVVSLVLMAVGSDLINKDASTMESEWSDQSNNAVGRRAALMENFNCCGFYMVTDSYKFATCPKLTSSLLSCHEATQNYLETDVYPIARGAIGIGVIEFLSVLVSCLVIFTSKDLKSEFYDNPFRDG